MVHTSALIIDLAKEFFFLHLFFYLSYTRLHNGVWMPLSAVTILVIMVERKVFCKYVLYPLFSLHFTFCFYFKGRKLSAELLLGLSLQRGSLRYLLEWVHMALSAATTAAEDTSDG